jgi:sugar (pentulose or hexulose) kinase
MRAGQLAHNAGSTDVLAMCVEKPVPMEGILTRPVGVGRVFAERWLAVRTIAAAGSAVDWARRVLFSELAERAWRRVLAKECGRVMETGGVSCVPSFAGERAAIEQKVGATFEGVKLATEREDILRGIVRGLAMESGVSYSMLSKLEKPEKVVYEMGGGSALRQAMHGFWAGKHVFRELEGDSLRGLVELARRVEVGS